MRAATILIIAGISFSSIPVAVAEIYRSLDAEGNVTYTDAPPEGEQTVEKVRLPPEPSAENIRDTELRNMEIRRAADSASQKRLDEKRKKSAKVAQARKTLAEAEAKLAETKAIRDEDRQNMAGGKRRVHPDYFARVNAAKLEVEKAKKALRKARGY
ncbi:MAG: DUF4124 domain-containing protein [Candidatus Thiodiazotropha sp. (ex Semelilucina semeliformis)]|nr:DUF4124 domain-containing protein [Candidatus Thiodiazotropha sp. (ex Myrtea spinifera)]MCU7807868.1 DUF4124 domain-containing protein [Candidatus Thiodiazotropha sp. (ex Semelilucina semeliformis)]MCU7828615.1 DUF4124 domain-containing protein [Candidatus Thiodiazotropha sp. (ex Myrtea sp. 'scaly one' KF741663)]